MKSNPLYDRTDYDGTSHLAEETRNPSKRGPVAIVSAVAIAGLVGFLLNITLSFCIRDVDRTLQSTTGLAAAQIIFDVSGFKYGSIIWFFVGKQSYSHKLQCSQSGQC